MARIIQFVAIICRTFECLTIKTKLNRTAHELVPKGTILTRPISIPVCGSHRHAFSRVCIHCKTEGPTKDTEPRVWAMASPTSLIPASLCNTGSSSRLKFHRPRAFKVSKRPFMGPIRAKQAENLLQYRKLGDSDLNISEITLGTVSFHHAILTAPDVFFCYR